MQTSYAVLGKRLKFAKKEMVQIIVTVDHFCTLVFPHEEKERERVREIEILKCSFSIFNSQVTNRLKNKLHSYAVLNTSYHILIIHILY